MAESTGWSHGLQVSGDGRNLVSHAGAAVLRLLADRTGLTTALNWAMRRPGFISVHRRGRVLTDLATVIADGGEVISDFDVLGQSQELYGPVASTPTVWRTVNQIGEAGQQRIARAVAATRARVWQQITARHGGLPGVKVADKTLGGVMCIRIDATLVDAHSDTGTGGADLEERLRLLPAVVLLRQHHKALAGLLRTGTAGSNTAADHIGVVDASISAIPAAHRRRLLVTVDGAGFSHAMIDHLDGLNRRPGRQVWYTAGFTCDERARTAISDLPQTAWQVAIDADGRPRTKRHADGTQEVVAQVAELTGLLRSRAQLAGWPDDMRIIVRRERPLPGAQLSLFDERDG